MIVVMMGITQLMVASYSEIIWAASPKNLQNFDDCLEHNQILGGEFASTLPSSSKVAARAGLTFRVPTISKIIFSSILVEFSKRNKYIISNYGEKREQLTSSCESFLLFL
jgi:hypothetical protein